MWMINQPGLHICKWLNHFYAAGSWVVSGGIGFCNLFMEILVLSSGEVSLWKIICIFFPLFLSLIHTHIHNHVYSYILFFCMIPMSIGFAQVLWVGFCSITYWANALILIHASVGGDLAPWLWILVKWAFVLNYIFLS